MASSGVLYVVATPIGNLSDITVRGLEVLREADVIACEDTRTSSVLLRHWKISTGTISVHKFSESRKVATIMALLAEGKKVALISDAGTPAISDPGTRLVAEAHLRGFKVCPIPGPSSVTAALSVSGMDISSFYWTGFVPKGPQARRKLLKDISARRETCVVFETARRISDTLALAAEVLGPRRIALCREMTKLHEEVLRGTATELLERLAAKPVVKGEIVLVIEASRATEELLPVEEAVGLLMEEGYSGKVLAQEAKKRFGISRQAAYQAFLQLRPEESGEEEVPS